MIEKLCCKIDYQIQHQVVDISLQFAIFNKGYDVHVSNIIRFYYMQSKYMDVAKTTCHTSKRAYPLKSLFLEKAILW